MINCLAICLVYCVIPSVGLSAEGDIEAVQNWLDILAFLVQLIFVILLWVWIVKKVDLHLQMQDQILQRLDKLEAHMKQTAKSTTYLSDVTAEGRGELED